MHSKNASMRCYGLRSMVKSANGLMKVDRRRIAKIFAIVQYKMYAVATVQYTEHIWWPMYTYLFGIPYNILHYWIMQTSLS